VSTVKVSELPVLASADAADEFVVVDDSAGVTKKITTAGLNGSLDVASLDDYEFGTWTPLAGDNSTPVVNNNFVATYFKIGDWVTLTAGITLPNPNPGVASRVYGFPFAAVTTEAAFGCLGFNDANKSLTVRKDFNAATHVDFAEPSDATFNLSGVFVQFRIAYKAA